MPTDPGSTLDSEMPDPDGSLSYGDLPDVRYDPDEDFRSAQLSYMSSRFGEFGPIGPSGEFGPDEATDG